MVSLGEICTFNYGKALPESSRAGGEVPVYGSNGIVGQHSSAITSGRTIVIGRKGSFGVVNYSDTPCWPIDTAYFIDENSTKADIRWLSYRLAALGLNKLNKAAAVPGLNRDDAYRQQLLLPPLLEQRRIAAILDQADALRTKRREALAQLDSLTQSIFIEMFGDPKKNPKGWKLSNLPEVTEFQEGPGILAKDFRECGVPLVRLAGIGGSEASLQGCNFVAPEMFAKKWAHFALNEGDILVLTSATFGNPTVVGKEAAGAIFYTGIIRFRPKNSALDSIYLRHFLASSWFLRQAKALASGAVIKHFGPTHLKQMTIPVPTLLVQQQFAERAAGVERLRVPVVQALAEAEKLFTSLQHRAFRGEL